MAINQDLVDQIKVSLGNSLSPSLTSANAANDLYEAYVFSLVLDAARTEGAVITYRDRVGAVPVVFLFRTSPSRISIAVPNYCYADIFFQGKPGLEAHVGIYVSDKAKVRHETDVVVLRRDEAQTCRAAGDIDPRYSKLILSAECKMYQNATLDIGLGRGFLGLSAELKGVTTTFVANKGAGPIERLLVHHRKGRALGVIPANLAQVNQLRVKFESSFIDFKAKN